MQLLVAQQGKLHTGLVNCLRLQVDEPIRQVAVCKVKTLSCVAKPRGFQQLTAGF